MTASRTSLSVLILSDTHGWIDPRVIAFASRCDYALHAGDVGAAAVIESLDPRRSVIAVRGNNDVPAKWGDDGDLLECLPFTATLALPGGALVVEHGHRAGGVRVRHERLRRRHPEARAVVYGHSHRLVVDTDASPWVLNPGAAGRSRTFGGPSCLILHAAEEAWRVEVLRFAPLR